MLVGGSGHGKTILMSNKLANLSDNDYGVTNISLNYHSTSGKYIYFHVMSMLEFKPAKKGG